MPRTCEIQGRQRSSPRGHQTLRQHSLTIRKGKVTHEPKAQVAGAYPCFLYSLKHALEYCYSPSGQDARPSQCYSPAVCRRYPFYTCGGRRETKWRKVPCLRKQCHWQWLNSGPPDLEFEVFTAWPLMPLQHVSSILGAKVKPQRAPGSSRAPPYNNLFLSKEQAFSVFLLKL